MAKINPLSKIAKQLGKIGGKKSAEVRFKGKSKEEISEMMRRVKHKGKEYTIKKRTFAAIHAKINKERDKLNSDVLTSEYMPSMKYQLVCNSTEFAFATKKECYKMLKKLGIPLQ